MGTHAQGTADATACCPHCKSRFMADVDEGTRHRAYGVVQCRRCGRYLIAASVLHIPRNPKELGCLLNRPLFEMHFYPSNYEELCRRLAQKLPDDITDMDLIECIDGEHAGL